MKIGSLFTGYGGLDMAAHAILGGTTAWVSDIDPGAARLLAHHYSDIPNLGDIAAVDWTAVEPVDVITGGFPCQDISNAGKRAGIEGARSGLWANSVDAIRVLRPRYVLVENVAALVVRGLDRVLADLAALGFDAEWTVVRASDVGAPHGRRRLFLVAQDTDRAARGERRLSTPGQAESGRSWADAGRRGRAPAADADGPAPRAQRDRLPEQDAGDHERRRVDPGGRFLGWGPYADAVQRWERVIGRVAPDPAELGARGSRVLSPPFVEWMMGLPAGWITDVPGLSRSEQLKLCGNGVVPRQGAAAFAHLLDHLTESEAAAC